MKNHREKNCIATANLKSTSLHDAQQETSVTP